MHSWPVIVPVATLEETALRHLQKLRSAAMFVALRLSVFAVMSVSPRMGWEDALAMSPATERLADSSRATAPEALAARLPTASAPT